MANSARILTVLVPMALPEIALPQEQNPLVDPSDKALLHDCAYGVTANAGLQCQNLVYQACLDGSPSSTSRSIAACDLREWLAWEDLRTSQLAEVRKCSGSDTLDRAALEESVGAFAIRRAEECKNTQAYWKKTPDEADQHYLHCLTRVTAQRAVFFGEKGN